MRFYPLSLLLSICRVGRTYFLLMHYKENECVSPQCMGCGVLELVDEGMKILQWKEWLLVMMNVFHINERGSGRN